MEVEGLTVAHQNRDCTEEVAESHSSIYSQVKLIDKLIKS